MREHLLLPGLLHVEDLALEGKDGLEPSVAAHLGRASGRFTLYQEQLAQGGVPFLVEDIFRPLNSCFASHRSFSSSE